jgi:hypothetical protein
MIPKKKSLPGLSAARIGAGCMSIDSGYERITGGEE